jgi:predicted nucleic acid-binding protein
MNDRTFIDSNIWLYLFDADDFKKRAVLQLLTKRHFISTQVLSENANVCLKKHRLSENQTLQHILNLIESCQVIPVGPATVEFALRIRERYQLGFYDSQILASVIENRCTVLLSEDFSEGIIFEKQIRVVNPFHVP